MLGTDSRTARAAAALWEDRSPATLERFLRARDYNVGVASALFLEHRAWRQSLGWVVGPSGIPPKLWAEQKGAIQAISTDGHTPLLVIVVRNHSMVGREMPPAKRFIVHAMDRVCDSLRPGGRFVVAIDFEGMGYRNADAQVLLACFDLLQRFYVERVDAMWFVQPPAVFWAIWKVVRPFIAAKTRDKIHFVSKRSVGHLVLSRFHAQDVPPAFGGTGELRPLTPQPLPWELPGLARRRRY